MSAASRFLKTPHRRFNPLSREWVLVSPQRTQRPWQGKIEKAQTASNQSYDPTCYLCPGNVRANGERNPQYESTFVFENDFPALLPTDSEGSLDEAGLIVARAERGVCLVGCFTPRHDLAIAKMTEKEIRPVIDLWAETYAALASLNWVRHIQIFENRGLLMGASNPHPHCQIWANATIPDEPSKELASFASYYETNKTCLLCDYASLEIKLKERIVYQNPYFIALVPYWAVWPFEVLILTKHHHRTTEELSPNERDCLADITKQVTKSYDNLFRTPFPYSMGIHQSPVNEQTASPCHFHAHYYPPLLRSATVQKFMVGYELLASPQRDITPEEAASLLRAAMPLYGSE
jgi:UDPglucose--hexose-1-phosphate uridylyltransferase